MNALVIKQIAHLLMQKTQLLLDYEEQTLQLLACAPEEMHVYVERRQELISEVEAADAQIRELASQQDDGGKHLLSVVHNKCNPNALEPALAQLYDLGQGLFAVANRIGEADRQAMRRAQDEKEMLLKKIRNVNQSASAKASKYRQPDIPQARVLADKKV